MKKMMISCFSQFDKTPNRDFVRATIQVCDYTQIANGTKFTKASLSNAMKSLDFIPVIGYWKDDEKDFQGHGIEYYLDEEGNLAKDVKTIPYGVVINDTARFENVVVGNEIREVLLCDCYLWNERNPEQINKIKENSMNHSMEVTIDEYTDMGNYIQIDKFNFNALCIISCTPAFECGNIRVGAYSQNDFKVDYQKMMTALDKFLNFEKGGVIVEDNKEILEEAVENNVEEFSEQSVEEVVETVSENNKEETFETEQEEVVEDVENNEEKVEEETTIDYSVEFESLQAKYSELETSKNELNIKYEALMEEVCELREYKATKEKEYREAKERELFARFETLKDEERFVKLVENKANYSLEELEEKCYAIKGMVAETKESKKSKKVENTSVIDKVYSANLEDNIIGKYDAFIKKYSRNN